MPEWIRFFFGFTCKSQAWMSCSRVFEAYSLQSYDSKSTAKEIIIQDIRWNCPLDRFSPNWMANLTNNLAYSLTFNRTFDYWGLLSSCKERTLGTHDVRCAYDVTQRSHTSNRILEWPRASLCRRSNGGRVFDGFRPLIPRISKLV